MKSRLLFTGGTGFIGTNVLPILKEKFDVFTPDRYELNLFDSEITRKYLIDNNIRLVMHCANPNPAKESEDTNEKLLRDSLQLFISLYKNKDVLDKIVFLGSGATYDKTKDIVSVTEDKANDSIPKDDYGFAKFIMNYLATDNVYNLCVFGCYGPGDAESKFITHCIRCVLRNEPITIRQNCLFDYMHVFDLGKIMSWILSENVKYHSYNACSGKKVSLLQLAEEVKRQMNSDLPIIVLKDGMNLEYTASNGRLLEEYREDFISIEDGISIQIKWEKEHFKG